MVLVQKWPFFKFFLLGNKGQKNVFYDILERKNVFQSIKTRSSKRRKYEIFFKGVNPCFWSKNGHFSNFFFFGNKRKKNAFYDILERKNVFLEYKSKKFKKTKK